MKLQSKRSKNNAVIILFSMIFSILFCICFYDKVIGVLPRKEYVDVSIATYMSIPENGLGKIKFSCEHQLSDYIIENSGFVQNVDNEDEMELAALETGAEDSKIVFRFPINSKLKLNFQSGLNNGLGVLITNIDNKSEEWITADILMEQGNKEIVYQVPEERGSIENTFAIKLFLFTFLYTIIFIFLKILIDKTEFLHILGMISIRQWVFLSVISVFSCFFFSDIISDMVYEKAKYTDLSVEIYNDKSVKPEGSIKIIDNYYLKNNSIDVIDEKKYFYGFEQLKESVVENKDYNIIPKSRSKYNYAYFESTDFNSKLAFKLRVYPTTCITFKTDATNMGIVVRSLNNKVERWITSEELSKEEIKCIKYYPFEVADYAYIFVYFIACYIILFFAFLIIYSILWYWAGNIGCKNGFWMKSNYRKMFCLLFSFHYFLLVIIFCFYDSLFKVGNGSDAYYYMYPDVYASNGTLSIEQYLATRYNFRGYLPHLVSFIFNIISDLTGINAMYFQFLITAGISSFTTAFAMPAIYECFTRKKVKNFCIAVTWLMFVSFWFIYNFFVLSDIPAAMAAICAMAFGMQAVLQKRPRRMFLSGIFMGIACCYRINYQYANYALVMVLIIFYVMKIIRLKKRMDIHQIVKRNKIYKVIIAYFLGLLLISMPQFVTNIMQGHYGMFPYATNYNYDIQSGKFRSASIALHSYQFNKASNLDKQTASIDQYFYSDKRYTGGDGLFIVMARPLEFLNNYTKKIFWAMSASWETIYIDKENFSPYIYLVNNLFSIINYTLFGTFIFCLTKRNKKVFPPGLGICYGVSILCTTVLQATQHIERRYFLFNYLLIYCFAGVFVLNYILNDKEEAKKYFNWKYALFLIVFVLLMYEMRVTFSDNFVYPLYT